MPIADPIATFQDWLSQAVHAGVAQPEAMCLATAGADGRPSCRVVLLKQVDQAGFVFFTNTRSRKGDQLAHNAHAALCFFWEPLGRQVRVEGAVEPVSDAEADAYFASRPRASQLGAWASSQSQPLSDRAELLRRLHEQEQRFADREVERPSHWSGYRVVPERIELWTQGEHRLHERHLFTRAGASWQHQLLAP